MKQLITLTMYSIKDKININSRPQCFEIFGYDFLIDCDFYVWLIEANTNPCIEESSAMLSALLHRMLGFKQKKIRENINNIN